VDGKKRRRLDEQAQEQVERVRNPGLGLKSDFTSGMPFPPEWVSQALTSPQSLCHPVKMHTLIQSAWKPRNLHVYTSDAENAGPGTTLSGKRV
jgi:hypothetical protein